MFYNKICIYAQKKGGHEAIKDNLNSYSYATLWSIVRQKQLIAYKNGVSNKTKIILIMENSCEWVICFLTFTLLGAKIIPMSPKTSDEYIQKVQEELKADLVFNKELYDSYFENNNDDNDNEEMNFSFPNDNEEIIYHITSGSTGKVKFCIRTLGQFYHEALMYQKALGINENDSIVCPLPIYHSYAFGFAIIAGLASGARIVLLKNFIPRQYLNTLMFERATISLIVPIMANLLSKTFLPNDIDISLLRYIVVGAGSISEEVFQSFKQKYSISLATNYGSSETGGIITRIAPELYPSIGTPMYGVNVQIRDDKNKLQPPNIEGKIWVKTPSMLNRYHNNSDIFDKDGFYYMGDLGYKDEKGNIFLTGREKNLVNIGGKKVNPAFVEKIILLYPHINETIVFGYQRTSGEELLAAIIVTKEEINQKQFNEFLKAKLEVHMIPSILRFLSKIPKDEMGKIKKEEIINLIVGTN